MSLRQRRTWLIAYDIRCPKRLSRLHHRVKARAIPVQYSVFLFEGSAGDLGNFLTEIGQYIDSKEDDVRAYPIPERPEIHVVGRGAFPASACIVSAEHAGIRMITSPLGIIEMLSSK